MTTETPTTPIETDTTSETNESAANEAVETAAATDGADAPAEAAKAEGEKEAPEGDAAAEPVDYAALLAEGLPEGVEPDAGLIEKIAPLLDGLPADKVGALRDAYAEIIAARATEQVDSWKSTIADWEAKIQADKDFGGKKLADSRATAAKALDHFGSPELRQALDQYGFGNNPELFRFAVKVGQALAEGGLETGLAPAVNETQAALQAMYPNSPELFAKGRN